MLLKSKTFTKLSRILQKTFRIPNALKKPTGTENRCERNKRKTTKLYGNRCEKEILVKHKRLFSKNLIIIKYEICRAQLGIGQIFKIPTEN